MTVELKFPAEFRAQEAQELPAFDRFNLLGVKRELGELLGLIGRDGIFQEYTKHDISHVDAVIENLDWIIPAATRELMTAADWLLTVLGIYLHDLGMLVSTQEFEKRQGSGFVEFRDKILFADPDGTDYMAQVDRLEPERRERFLYQEFVRHHHAERIRNWVLGKAPEHLGVTVRTMEVLDDLLKPLNDRFRKDLALVCESHHLDDLKDFRKYPTSQPYGKSKGEQANVHYAVLLLRTADLLDITSDRTPSVLFRVIDPRDPVSQDEWAKQKAVIDVRPKLGLNAEGFPHESAEKDSVEVHALFKEEKGFFGLTTFLTYVRAQLAESYDAARLAQRTQASHHEFPWRDIDDSKIETEGFIRRTFEFEIDQAKILDLLTGHTLYNDITVVLRELVQNAIDALRLQHKINNETAINESPGAVSIAWDSESRILSVADTGTGMTQDMIEKHLLKVGASRYQDPAFRKQYPDFSPISRFGIGILASFMIADEVEISTVHLEEAEARRLSLRSVHGRYLIRLLDKTTDETARQLSPHGTLVKIKVRASADMPDVVEATRRWIVLPDCRVTVRINAGEEIEVGFDSPSAALRAQMVAVGYHPRDEAQADEGATRIEIRQTSLAGVTLAYAVHWNQYFRDWSFVAIPEHSIRDEGPPLLGTCVEGIRVEARSPGFAGLAIWALANASGPHAPRTNVARSGIEATPEMMAMLRAIYQMYCSHIASEIAGMQRRGFSITWATAEAAILISDILDPRKEAQTPIDAKLLSEAINSLPIFLLEQDQTRCLTSATELANLPEVWTVHSQSSESAEVVIRESASPASLTGLMQALGGTAGELPPQPLVCGLERIPLLARHALRNRSIGKVNCRPEQRRLDILWQKEDRDNPRWDVVSGLSIDIPGRYGRSDRALMIPVGEIEVVGLAGEAAFKVLGDTYLTPGTALRDYVVEVRQTSRDDENWLKAALGTVLEALGGQFRTPIDEEGLARYLPDHSRIHDISRAKLHELVAALNSQELTVFDPSRWSRSTA